MRLKRKNEEKLWQRFRAACNAVFERRDAQRAEQEAQRQEQARSRQLLLDAFAATLAGTNGNGIKHALARFRADWSATGQALRPAGQAGNPRERSAATGTTSSSMNCARKSTGNAFELLAQRAALAERVEAAALAGEPIEAVVAEAKQAWIALPPLPGNTESLLAQRFAAASGITRADLAAGRETWEALLLDLEIALGLTSPETYAAARRERQLEQLQKRFDATAAQGMEPEVMLARCYATAALPDAAFTQRIEAIVRLLAEQAALRSGTSAQRKRA